jgi:FMN reductase
MSRSVRLVGLGGSLRAGWTGRTALQTALDGAQVANAEPSLTWVRDLDLPMYTRESGGADWLILLAERDPPYLTNKPVGLVATAGGVQGLQAVNSMEFVVRALRGWSVPLVQPVAQSWQTFDPDGRLTDDMIASSCASSAPR